MGISLTLDFLYKSSFVYGCFSYTSLCFNEKYKITFFHSLFLIQEGLRSGGRLRLTASGGRSDIKFLRNMGVIS